MKIREALVCMSVITVAAYLLWFNSRRLHLGFLGSILVTDWLLNRKNLKVKSETISYWRQLFFIDTKAKQIDTLVG